jgi:hypothetical protein
MGQIEITNCSSYNLVQESDLEKPRTNYPELESGATHDEQYRQLKKRQEEERKNMGIMYFRCPLGISASSGTAKLELQFRLFGPQKAKCQTPCQFNQNHPIRDIPITSYANGKAEELSLFFPNCSRPYKELPSDIFYIHGIPHGTLDRCYHSTNPNIRCRDYNCPFNTDVVNDHTPQKIEHVDVRKKGETDWR